MDCNRYYYKSYVSSFSLLPSHHLHPSSFYIPHSPSFLLSSLQFLTALLHHSSSFPLSPSSSTRASEQNAAYETEQLPNATNDLAVYQEPEQDPIIWTNLSSNMYENTAFFSLHTKQFEGQGVPEPGTFV